MMPLLANLLVNLFGGFVAWLLQFVSRKVAYGLAAVTMMGTLTGSLFLLMRNVLQPLASALTGAPSIFLQMFVMGVPPSAVMCASSYVTIWTACTAYTWQRDLIHLAIKA